MVRQNATLLRRKKWSEYYRQVIWGVDSTFYHDLQEMRSRRINTIIEQRKARNVRKDFFYSSS